eukprot:scaffold5277_cov404-Prasinococcus_capsulatus_cf.AAC.12
MQRCRHAHRRHTRVEPAAAATGSVSDGRCWQNSPRAIPKVAAMQAAAAAAAATACRARLERGPGWLEAHRLPSRAVSCGLVCAPPAHLAGGGGEEGFAFSRGGRRRGTQPAEARTDGTINPSIHPSVRPSVRPSVCPSVPSFWITDRPGQRWRSVAGGAAVQ